MDLFYHQSRAIPAILFLHSRSVSNSAVPPKFWNVREGQGHLQRLRPLDREYRLRYSYSQFSTPGVLGADPDTAYAYPAPLTGKGRLVYQVSDNTVLPDGVGQMNDATSFYSVTIQGVEGDTVRASRSGIVIHPPSLLEDGSAQVVIHHADGGNMWYVGLDKRAIQVKEGDRISAGQPMGKLDQRGQLVLFLRTLDTLQTAVEHPWSGRDFYPLYVHYHAFRIHTASSFGGLFPVMHQEFPAEGRPEEEGRQVHQSDIDSVSQEAFKQTIARIREVQQVDRHWPELLEMLDRWEEVFNDSVRTAHFLAYISHGMMNGVEADRIRKYLRKNPEYGEAVSSRFTDEDMRVMTENAALAGLIQEGLVDVHRPDENIPSSKILDELTWMDIRNSMWIAEIGAGNGVVSYVLSRHYPNLKVMYNDVDFEVLRFAKWIMSRDSLVDKPHRTFPVWGGKKSTQLESFRFDRILVRDALHHFSHLEDMLSSIRKSMDHSSQLLVSEPMGELDPDTGCDEVLSSEGIRTILRAAGFHILEERINIDHKEIWLRCGLLSGHNHPGR